MTALSERLVTAAFEHGLNWHAQDREDFTNPGAAERAVEAVLDAEPRWYTVHRVKRIIIRGMAQSVVQPEVARVVRLTRRWE